MNLLGAADEFVAVHLGHEEIGKEQVDGAGDGLLDDFERVLRAERRDNAVASCLKQKGADGECLFVVVYAENGFLGPQFRSLFCGSKLNRGF